MKTTYGEAFTQGSKVSEIKKQDRDLTSELPAARLSYSPCRQLIAAHSRLTGLCMKTVLLRAWCYALQVKDKALQVKDKALQVKDKALQVEDNALQVKDSKAKQSKAKRFHSTKASHQNSHNPTV